MKKNKIVVYTTIFGNYDHLPNPPTFYQNIDYLCFTDSKNLKSLNWKIIFFKKKNFSPKKMNRYIKINAHKFLKFYEISLYHDANVTLFVNPNYLIKKYLKNKSLAVPKHRYRNNTKDEAMCVLSQFKLKKNYQTQIHKIIKTPIYWLTENRLILRRHNDYKIKKIMSVWWHFYKLGIIRDQISFPYSCKKNNFKPEIIKSNFKFLEFFFVNPHKNSSIIFKIKFFLILIHIKYFLLLLFKIKNNFFIFKDVS